MTLSKKAKILTAVSAVALLGTGVVSGAAIASGKRFSGHRMMHNIGLEKVFGEFDTNKDNIITREEVLSTQRAALQQYDADNNGSLSIDEFKPYFADKAGFVIVRGFQFIDRDGNAELTEQELVDLPIMMLERLDRDGDGKVAKRDIRSRKGWRRAGHREGWDYDDDDDYYEHHHMDREGWYYDND